MLTFLYRSTVMVLSCLVFFFVVSAAKADEAAGKYVLEIYNSMNSLMSIWLPILLTTLACLFLLNNKS